MSTAAVTTGVEATPGHSPQLETIVEDQKLNGHTQHNASELHLRPSAARQSSAVSNTTAPVSHTLTGVRSALGLHARAPIDKDHDEQAHTKLWWPRVRLALREPFSEFAGVFIMVMFGNGSVAQVLLSENFTTAPGGAGFGQYQSITWGWGLGVMLGIIIAGDSGAYLNPAVTLANCVYRGLPFRRFPVYFVAQFLGGMIASGVVYANYIASINNFAGEGVRLSPPSEGATAQIFCTFPAGAFLNTANEFFSEFIAATLLIFVIFGLKDASNSGGIRSDGNWFPLCLFFLIFGLGACFGMETGYAINVARDTGPRVMATILGYHGLWTAGNYYFWIPIVASFTGCLFGGALYDLLIYTGPESPINSPWFGLPYLFRPDRAVKSRWDEREDEFPVGGDTLQTVVVRNEKDDYEAGT